MLGEVKGWSHGASKRGGASPRKTGRSVDDLSEDVAGETGAETLIGQ